MDDWLLIDQNDWVVLDENEEEPCSSPSIDTSSLASSCEAAELSSDLSSSLSENKDYDASIAPKPTLERLQQLLNQLWTYQSTPLSHELSLQSSVQEIADIVLSGCAAMSNHFQESKDQWQPMFQKLYRLLQKRQVHYDQAALCLFALTTLLELSTDKEFFYKQEDAAKVLFETLRNFGPLLTSTQEDVVRLVFRMLASSPEQTKMLAENSSRGKSAVNIVNMIETVMKRCNQDDVKKYGSTLLQTCDGVCFLRSNNKRQRTPLTHISVINNYA